MHKIGFQNPYTVIKMELTNFLLLQDPSASSQGLAVTARFKTLLQLGHAHFCKYPTPFGLVSNPDNRGVG